MIKPEILTGRLGNKMFQFAYLYAQAREGIIKDVYVQDYRYFEKYADEIKQMFGEGIGYLSQVGIHVRRGKNPFIPSEPKYNENPFHFNISDTDYYERAMALFPNEKFLVFSDDVEWCKEKFRDNPDVQVMDKGDEIEDFNMLASCKHLILANSSYSWWVGWLCPNESKKIVCPKQWYTDKETRTILPDNWIKL
ncbi:MAG: alpha-1,2-fucosyltransferase [Patescibacteria group bacterium]